METDNASAFLQSLNTEPVFDTWRGIGSDWFNAQNVAKEDFLNSEQSANNQFLRDLYQMDIANSFNSSEAQKQRDFEERMSNTSYQRAMEDLRAAGLNPVLAYSNGASTPSGSSATSVSPSRGSGRVSNSGVNTSAVAGSLISGLIKIAAGAISKDPVLAVSGITQTVSGNSRSTTYNYKKYK